MPTPVIRLARETDLDAIREITNDDIAVSPANFHTRPLTPDEVLIQWYDTKARYPWLVSEVETDAAPTIAGYAKASQWKPRDAYDWTAEVTVYVRPTHHRQGIGRALYARLFEMLEAQGYRRALAGITLPNPASVGVHESLGFTHVGTFPSMGFKKGQWRDVGYWERPIGAGGSSPPTELHAPDP